MTWKVFTILLVVIFIIKIIKTDIYKVNLLYLAISSLYGIPLIFLGNSSSSGIFLFDLVLLAFSLKYIAFGKIPFRVKLSSNYFLIFQIFIVYVFMRTIFVLAEGYGYYNNFIFYGFYRWCSFGLFLYFASSQTWKLTEVFSILKSFFNFLMIFMSFAILHQQGFLQLSGYEALRMDESFFENEEFADLFFRTFLGNGSASVGFISVLGIIISVLFIRLKHNLKYSTIGLLMSVFVLFGSWSRSDLIALFLSFAVLFIISSKEIYGSLIMKKILIITSVAMIAFIFLLITDSIEVITENRTYGRFFKTEYTSELNGKAEGTFAYRIKEQVKVINHLVENVRILFFGYGPNGYRMVTVRGISTMGFGHNVYLHTIVELGLIGGVFIFLFFYNLFRRLYIKFIVSSTIYRVFYILPFILLIQRLIAGYAVDTLFAIDNLLPMTIIFLFFTVIISETKYIKT